VLGVAGAAGATDAACATQHLEAARDLYLLPPRVL